MKNRFIIIYTIFASAVFIFAMGFFGYNLFNEYNTNLEKSESKFTEFANDIRTLSYSQEQNSPSYVQGIKKAVGDPADYSFIQVRRNNETLVLYPTGKSREETVSKLTKSFTQSLTVNKQSVTIDCNIYLIRPDSIFYYARISFLMILIITIITIIMIIYLNITDAASNVISLEEDEENVEDEIQDEYSAEDEAEEYDSETEAEVETEAEAEAENEVVAEGEVETEAEQEEKADDTAEEEAVEEKHTEVTPEEVKAILSEPLTDSQAAEAEAAAKTEEAGTYAEPVKLPSEEEKPAADEPSGLFDPDTGIGWESYLYTRLNNEIDRATASEIDLSLFVIRMTGIDKNMEEYKNVCNYLGIQFQFKDLLFEHKENCIVAIKISMNVDEALKLADKLQSDICNIINSKECRIGISSRSIRMVSGDRLVLEAEQAIEHSDENSPVIAFRVDSEKYRQLMEQNKD